MGRRLAALGLAAITLAGCSWDGLRRGLYEGATTHGRQTEDGRPPAEPAPTFDQYEQMRTGRNRGSR